MKSSNILKGLYILYPSWTYYKNVRVVHSVKNNQCRMKEWKTGMVVSTDAEEAFQSNNFMIYKFFFKVAKQKTRNKENFSTWLNVYKKSTVTHWWKTEGFPHKIEKTRMHTFTSAMQQYIGVSIQTNQARKRKKGIPIGKEGVKLPLFSDNMILHIKSTKESMKNY